MLDIPEPVEDDYRAEYISLTDDHILPDALKGFHSWWLQLGGGDRLPKRSHVKFADLKGWHAYVVLSKVVDHCSDLEYIIVGEGVNQLFMGQMKPGTRFSSLHYIPEDIRKWHLDRLSAGDCYAIFDGVRTLDSGVKRTGLVMDLPLAGQDSDDLEFVLTFFNIDGREKYGLRPSAIY